ncbi:MAG TPA: ABC transporter substrate-binding protein [Dongiaceae bacterium]|nr:ABC transporter substrate-binding protein [Dongiaceae bacterium]
MAATLTGVRMISFTRRVAVLALLLSGLGLGRAALADPAPASWDQALAQAKGETVYFNAWGGDPKINAYVSWAAERVQAEYGVTLRQVKLSDTAEAVTRVLAEKTAGRSDGGSVDLIWINGANFAAMKRQGLLFGPFTQMLPNDALVDVAGKPTTAVDFTVPVDGLEAPWGMAQIVFIYDSARLQDPPRSMAALLAWAEAHPGRFTYPAPPDFTGATFLKQALYEMTDDPAALAKPVDESGFAAATAPLWRYLDKLNPLLWRHGQQFPQNSEAMRQLLDDGEIDIAFNFNPSEASAAIAQGLLPPTVRSYVFDRGSIANTHFVAIPFNANAKAGAMVVANFLMSPEAQARKQDPALWGDPTVLDVTKLDPAGRKLFADLPLGAATLPPEKLGRTLPEPDPSWMTRLAEEWRQHYAR